MTQNIVIPLRKRTLANVLLDIEAQHRRCDRLWGGDLESDELDRLWALRDEARDMIEAATGCTWDQISGANL